MLNINTVMPTASNAQSIISVMVPIHKRAHRKRNTAANSKNKCSGTEQRCRSKYLSELYDFDRALLRYLAKRC